MVHLFYSFNLEAVIENTHFTGNCFSICATHFWAFFFFASHLLPFCLFQKVSAEFFLADPAGWINNLKDRKARTAIRSEPGSHRGNDFLCICACGFPVQCIFSPPCTSRRNQRRINPDHRLICKDPCSQGRSYKFSYPLSFWNKCPS